MYCRRCGTPLHTGTVICPECGARQRRQASSVRCASCHGRVPLAFTVCPHCGRDLKPAGPRWGIWLAAAMAIALLVLWGLGTLPIERAGQKIIGIKAEVAGLVQVLGPAPTAEKAGPTPRLIARTTLVAPSAPTAGVEQPVLAPQAEPSSASGKVESSTGEPSPTEAGLAAHVGTPATGTQTVTDVPTPTPTATPTLPPTATVPPPTPTAAPTAGSNANRYRIQSGDTLSGIAQRFNVSLEALLAANRMTASATLRIGQELVIPGAGVPTATPKPRATPTAAPTALPPTPAPNLPAPVLTGPGEQASYRGDKEQIFLIWGAVPGMTSDDKYQLVLRWTEQGALQEKSDLFTTATSIQAPPWLWGRADQPERRYQWFVKVARVTTDGQGGDLVIPLSPASQARTFYWN